jgi:hypothetical protein
MNILTHLTNVGSLTPLEALNEYGCFRLAAHIESLRKDGHRIFTEMVNEGGKKFAKYTLITRKD